MKQFSIVYIQQNHVSTNDLFSLFIFNCTPIEGVKETTNCVYFKKIVYKQKEFSKYLNKETLIVLQYFFRKIQKFVCFSHLCFTFQKTTTKEHDFVKIYDDCK